MNIEIKLEIHNEDGGSRGHDAILTLSNVSTHDKLVRLEVGTGKHYLLLSDLIEALRRLS